MFTAIPAPRFRDTSPGVALLKLHTTRSSVLVMMTYKETKEMGCTDIVYWKSEPQTNPKTGNEFFTPEDAKSLFVKLKEEHAKEIEEELNDIIFKHNISEDEDEFDAEYYWNIDNYIWQDAANLDDLIQEEENHADWVCHP